MPSWTAEQLQAITEEGKNIIVSAGAGSGKTAVLTERVIRKLKQGIHVNELLVLTFTNAAAAEMKERIRKAINKTPGLEEEANLIDGAYITTFDSFALSLVKKYHTTLNVTNNIKITDDVVINLAKNKILDQILEEKYLLQDSKFAKLIHDFCYKDDKDLKKAIIAIYQKIELKYDKQEYLNNYITNYFEEGNIEKLLQEYSSLITMTIKQVSSLIEELTTYFDGDYITKVEDNLYNLLNATTYEQIKLALDTLESFPRLPKNSPEEGKQIKKTITDVIKELQTLCDYTSLEEMKKEILATKNNQQELIVIIKDLDTKLTAYKKEHELYNFTDISSMAIQVVEENEEIRDELKDSFHEIMVDEYQDTSDTQEKFISLISNHNVYMVGDIKQSIYRFRNANPYIFKNKYDRYQNTDEGIKIDLVKNFRSRKEVLENINLLFNQFMDDEIGGAKYQESHQMVFGNMSYIEKGTTSQNYNLELLTYNIDKESNITKEEEEAFIIGNDIKTKIATNYQIFDKDTAILRKVEYSDFVILLDKSKNFDLYKKIFEYLQIPLSILKDESLSKDKDILVLKNLLALIIAIKEQKPLDELKYNFTSVARSFLYQLSDEEIYQCFTTNQFHNTPLYQDCLALSKELDTTSASQFFLKVIEKTNYEQKLITIGNIKAFQIRLEYFYNLICSLEQTGTTLQDFVTYLDELFEQGFDLKFNMNKSDSNSCKIMTIHKSKGLEFPICYFAGFFSRFNISELKERILYDNKYGIILPNVEDSYKDTIIKTLAKKTTKQEEISERIRLLYVAVTRAKEKMIIVVPEIEEQKEQLGLVPSYERLKYNSFYSIIKSIYTTLLPYKKLVQVEKNKDYLLTKQEEKYQNLQLKIDKLQVEELNIETEKMEDTRFSKDSPHLISKEEQEKLEFGTNIHEQLEQLDFHAPNFSYMDEKIATQIKLFLSSELIQKNLKHPMYKEYEFIYQQENTISHGIIDLLIETPEQLIIIDYKLKNIEDEAYENQLHGYQVAMEQKTNKQVVCYLYSILDNKWKQI